MCSTFDTQHKDLLSGIDIVVGKKLDKLKKVRRFLITNLTIYRMSKQSVTEVDLYY